MPNFGNSSARAPRGANRNSNFKPREDGRGGRAPHRADRTAAPAGKRPAFFEEQPARTSDGPSRGGRSGAREMRDGKADRGRDWEPRKSSGSRDARDFGSAPARKPRHTAIDRAGRDAPARDPQDRAQGRQWSDRPRFGDRDDRRSERPERGERTERFDRSDRSDRRPDSRSDDRRPAARSDDRRTTSRSSDRDDRRADDRRPAARSFDRDDRGRSASRDERRPDRQDRVQRDRSRDETFDRARSNNPNKKAFFEDVVLERLESAPAEDVASIESFGAMNLHPRLVTALEGMGAASPFPIQQATIPAAIEGRDVLGRGKTGSGKTIAFAVPIITKLVAGGSQPRKPNKPRALILAPTRELAEQIDRTASALARSVGFYTATIYGGVPQRRQEIAMSRGVDIVVATPGRLEDLIAQRIIDLSEVETVVVDEADHMCDLGFIEGVRRIIRATGESQKLLFSATLDREVDALVREFMPNPFVYEVPNETQETSTINHRVLIVDPDERSQVLLRLVQGEGKSLIFCRTKMTAERLSESLTAAGVPAARLHGDLNQNQRTRNLERFTRGQVRVLVATDVAARGIHVDDVQLVIQVDPPEEYKTYLHRSGRTGRAGKEGTVVTLIPRGRRRRVEDLLHRAEREGTFTEVRPSHPLLEQLAGPIAPAPAQDLLDFGDSRAGRAGGRGSDSRGSGSRESRSGGRGRSANYGGNGKGRWADRPSSEPRPRAKKYAN